MFWRQVKYVYYCYLSPNQEFNLEELTQNELNLQPACTANIFRVDFWPSLSHTHKAPCRVSRSRSLPLPPPVSSPRGTNATEWLLHSQDMNIQIGHLLRSPSWSDSDYAILIELRRNTSHTSFGRITGPLPLGFPLLLFLLFLSFSVLNNITIDVTSLKNIRAECIFFLLFHIF